MNAAALVATHHPSRVRLQLHSGQRVELHEPRFDKDTLTGLIGHDTTRVAVTDITTVADRRFSLGRTAARVGLGVAALFGLAALACAAEPCGY